MIATVTLNPAIDKTMVVPGFSIGRTNRGQVERVDLGGKGINVANPPNEFPPMPRAFGTDDIATYPRRKRPHACGVDDDAGFPILFPEWVTSTEHYWVTSRFSRNFRAGQGAPCGERVTAPAT